MTYGYDPHGRLQTTTDARTGVTTYSYYDDDQIYTVTTPDPDAAKSGSGYDAQTVTYSYDSAGRVGTVTQTDNGVVNTTYYSTGAVKRSWGSRTYPTEYTYDSQGRAKTLTTWKDLAGDAGKSVTTWNYNPLRGWLDNKRYDDNIGPGYTYKLSGRLLTRAWARGVTATYGYNSAGDLFDVSYSDATTPSVNLTFDRSGRPKSMSDGAGSRTLSYHSSGQLEDEIYSAGVLAGLSVERDYDSFNRLSGVSSANGSPLSAVTYGYDAASRLRTVTQGSNIATYSYVPNSPLVQTITFAQGGTTRLTTTKAYDNLNRLSSISSAASVSPTVSAAYTYNSANQRTKATREDNAYWGYNYDSLGQVTSGKKYGSDDTLMLGHDFNWTFDDIGNRKTATINAQTSSYVANSLNEYSSRTVPGMVEAAGTAAADAIVTVNRQATQRQGTGWYLSLPYGNTYEPTWIDLVIKGVRVGAGPGGTDAVATGTRHFWLPKSPESYTYDADGNLTFDGRWAYTWDAENRLTAMETRSDLLPPIGPFPLAQKRRVEFAYDGQGRRVSKKVYNWNGSGWLLANSTRFLYEGWNLIADLNALSGNSVSCTYAWGLDLSGGLQGAGGVGGLLFSNLYSTPSSYTTHSAAFDGNGNVIGLVDMATGLKSATYDYNAFGETIQSDGVASVTNHFRFSTKYTDDETGLLYYGFRFYQPTTGRWLSRDPMEEDGGVNLCAFVDNDAVGGVDFLGLWDTATHDLIATEWIRGVSGFGDLAKFKCGCCTINVSTEIQQGSAKIDGVIGPGIMHGKPSWNFFSAQSGKNAYQHHLANGNIGQSVDAARSLYNGFVEGRIAEAKRLAGAGGCDSIRKALRVLGEAFHDVSDGYSPEHEDFQKWEGPIHGLLRHPIRWISSALAHGAGETFKVYNDTREPDNKTPAAKGVANTLTDPLTEILKQCH